MYELAMSLLNQYVEIYTYLSKDKLYGEIIVATPYEIVLLRRHIDNAPNKNSSLYIPLNSVIYKIDCQYKCNTLYLCCIKDLCRCFISETLAGSIIYYSNNSIKLFLTYRRKIKPFRIKLS